MSNQPQENQPKKPSEQLNDLKRPNDKPPIYRRDNNGDSRNRIR